jgi:holo-[acyl-carrier protein] synthase
MDDTRTDWVGSLAGVESLEGAGGPVGIGVDVEEVDRWVQPNVALHALFTSEERSYCDSKARPAEAYAGHWCLKEAVVKALAGVELISPRQVEVAHHPDGRPRVVITASGLESVVDRVLVSVSHTRHVAVAVAMLSSKPPTVSRECEAREGR